MGAFPDDIIIEVFLTFNPSFLPRELSLRMLKTGLRREIYDPLRQFVESIVNINAPRDTGSLRESMERKVGEGKPTIDQLSNSQPFVVKLGTPGVMYAKPVNKMPTGWLKHPRRGQRNIGRQGDPLDDPKAKKGWYDLLLLNGRNRAMRLWKNYLKNIIIPVLKPLQDAGLIKSASTQANKLFIVKFK